MGLVPAYAPETETAPGLPERGPETRKAHGTSRYAVAIAWLRHRSPVMAPIPGTASLEHLAENMAAADLLARITEEEWRRLDAAA